MAQSKPAKNWIVHTESGFPWEREALEFVRTQFPSHEPYRAWTNFEFIGDDGSINEVDLLVFTPQGFFLIEIKSRPGRLRGDAGTWRWETDGKPTATVDNPLFLANSKAKKLRSLLSRQKAAKKHGSVPWIDAVVFCSASDLQCDLTDTAAHGVVLRDTEHRSGVMGLIKRRECPGLRDRPSDRHDKPACRVVTQAMDQAGIRPSQRSRKVGDYVLDHLINEGPGYQDWQATHTTLKSIRRRVRIYNVRTGASQDERDTIERAAHREAELLESLQHPGILRREGYTQHELGPALIFEHDPLMMRLDHFLAERHERLGLDERLDLIRQLAEVVRFAHQRRVVHRALSPQSVLVSEGAGSRLQLKVFNWQVGYRNPSSSTDESRGVTATSHVDRLVDDVSTAYIAPEALSGEDNTGEHLDVFSLGAIAWHVFTGRPPAANGLELRNRLHETDGLQISSVLNGAGENLQELIQWSTHADVGLRLDTVDEFLTLLEKVEDEATAPDAEHSVEDPNLARKDDVLPGGLRVIKRLGRGSCSIVLLVERDGEEFVLKAASDPEHNNRLRDEVDVLSRLHHNHIVVQCGTVEIGDRFAFLMRPVFADREKRSIETLRDRLRSEGRLHVDMLQRFGEDLLDVVKYLEEEAGIPHRDLKPDNIAIGQIKRGQKLHLVLFDFSLSRASTESLRAGTNGYIDPMLPLRKNKQWDLHAERYAAAATLYELAAGPGILPKWGDGASLPSLTKDEATIDGDRFDPSLRDPLTEFFVRAFQRDPQQRFDNAEQMLIAWRDCFVGIEDSTPLSDHDDDTDLRALLESATFDTQIPELGLGTRTTNALDKANVLTVEDLLTVPVRRLMKLRGVGNKTRREILDVVRILRERLGRPQQSDVPEVEDEVVEAEVTDVGSLSVDLLAQRVTKTAAKEGDSSRATLLALLGLDERLTEAWPSQTEVAPVVGVTRGRIGQLVSKFQTRWTKDAAVTALRSDLAGIVTTAGGVMSAAELAEALLVARGSTQDEPQRSRLASALTRVCVEVERTMSSPRFLMRRSQGRVLIALNSELADAALRLGDEADQIADEDPLVAPVRALARLRDIPVPPPLSSVSDARLLRLAAAVSLKASVSSRQELYPRGLDAGRALKLSQGALYGVPRLTVDQVHSRVRGRYPDAAPLPGHPELERLLRDAGFPFEWDALTGDGGCYVSRQKDNVTVTSASESPPRRSTARTSERALAPNEITPEIADARQFEEKLSRGIREGAFLTLLVNPRDYQQAAEEVSRRFPVQLVDFEGLLIDALREVADKAKVNWELVLSTDASPGTGDWDRLLLLLGRAMPLVEKQLAAADRTMLMIYPGLLARYEQMSLLQRLRDQVGRRDGIPGLWLLVPDEQHATIDGKAIPMISPAQCSRIPLRWLKNEHRAAYQAE